MHALEADIAQAVVPAGFRLPVRRSPNDFPTSAYQRGGGIQNVRFQRLQPPSGFFVDDRPLRSGVTINVTYVQAVVHNGLVKEGGYIKHGVWQGWLTLNSQTVKLASTGGGGGVTNFSTG